MKSSSGFIYSNDTDVGLGLMALQPPSLMKPSVNTRSVLPPTRLNNISTIRTANRRSVSTVRSPTPVVRRSIKTVRRPKPAKPKVTSVVRNLTQKPTAVIYPEATKSKPVATKKKPINKKMIALAGAGIVGAGILFKILR